MATVTSPVQTLDHPTWMKQTYQLMTEHAPCENARRTIYLPYMGETLASVAFSRPVTNVTFRFGPIVYKVADLVPKGTPMLLVTDKIGIPICSAYSAERFLQFSYEEIPVWVSVVYYQMLGDRWKLTNGSWACTPLTRIQDKESTGQPFLIDKGKVEQASYGEIPPKYRLLSDEYCPDFQCLCDESPITVRCIEDEPPRPLVTEEETKKLKATLVEMTKLWE